MSDSQDFFAGLDTSDFETEVVAASADHRGKFADAIAARQYVRAPRGKGKAKITLVSTATGTRFTYRIGSSDDGSTQFVSVLCGPDNTANYKYVGRIARDIFWAGRKVPRPGDISPDAQSSKAFAFAWRKLVQGTIPAGLEVWHEGSCGRCGRSLTVPESVARGLGPECAGKVGF
jgi:hypothetical protein